MKPTDPLFRDFFESCFDNSFAPSVSKTPPDNVSMDLHRFIEFFDNYPLPSPVQHSFNVQETDPCNTFGDILRKYFALGYREGVIDRHLNRCKVTQVAPGQFIFSGPDEFQPDLSQSKQEGNTTPSPQFLTQIFISELTSILTDDTTPDTRTERIVEAAIRFYFAMK